MITDNLILPRMEEAKTFIRYLYNTHIYGIFATCMYCKRGLFHLRKEIKSNEATDKQYSFIFKT